MQTARSGGSSAFRLAGDYPDARGGLSGPAGDQLIGRLKANADEVSAVWPVSGRLVTSREFHSRGHGNPVPGSCPIRDGPAMQDLPG